MRMIGLKNRERVMLPTQYKGLELRVTALKISICSTTLMKPHSQVLCKALSARIIYVAFFVKKCAHALRKCGV